MSNIIFLIGFSGSGKSTVGPYLAKKMKHKFVDADTEIEKQAGMAIVEIFQRHGEKRFRKHEQNIIRTIGKDGSQRMVVALGGGAMANPENRKLIQNVGTTVYLSCSVRELYRRLKDKIDRPLLQIPATPGLSLRTARIKKISSLLNKRQSVYRQSDIIVSTTSKTIPEIVSLIQRKIKKL